MRRRLDFVIPDQETARKIEDELLLAKIEERHMHFLAKDSADLGDLPEATLSQKTDLVFGMEKGLLVGAVTGAVIGFFIYLFTDLGALVGFGAVFALAILCAIIGMWASGMIGSSVPNPRLEKFRDTLQEGHILLMVDVPKERVDEITALIKKHHPDVEDYGEEPTTPPFP